MLSFLAVNQIPEDKMLMSQNFRTVLELCYIYTQKLGADN